jgi:hypothetical protein
VKRQLEKAVRESLDYCVRHGFEISDEKAFSVYVAFYLTKAINEIGHRIILQFERPIFKDANFRDLFSERERLDMLLWVGDERVGIEFKYPKKSDEQPVKKRAEVYQAIGRLVHLTQKGFLDRGFLICATDNSDVYSSEGKAYPIYNGYSIAKDAYILQDKPRDEIEKHPSYGRIWNCRAPNPIEFRWHETAGCAHRYLSPIEVLTVR